MGVHWALLPNRCPNAPDPTSNFETDVETFYNMIGLKFNKHDTHLSIFLN